MRCNVLLPRPGGKCRLPVRPWHFWLRVISLAAAVTLAINQAGGILGHKVACASADTCGEPADTVPAVGNLFDTAKNLELIIGCTSDEAASVVPVINEHKTVMFCMTGQPEFPR